MFAKLSGPTHGNYYLQSMRSCIVPNEWLIYTSFFPAYFFKCFFFFFTSCVSYLTAMYHSKVLIKSIENAPHEKLFAIWEYI